MDKNLFADSFLKSLNENFPKYSKYFDFDLQVFCELNTLLFEINKCQLLEFHRATITLTNHLLEKLLKLALIYNETGIGSIEVENWNSTFEEPNRKYSTIDLGNSIEKSKKLGLITSSEKEFLFNVIRVLMRNGFSHADSSEILKDFPEESKMYQGTISNPNEIKEVILNQKIIPFMQEVQMENFAKASSNLYFDFVFNLIFRIEKRLTEKFKKTSM